MIIYTRVICYIIRNLLIYLLGNKCARVQYNVEYRSLQSFLDIDKLKKNYPENKPIYIYLNINISK